MCMNIRKILTVSSFLATGAGIVLVLGGAWGMYFTHTNITQEKIVTPADSSTPGKPVRGPLTLKAQADVIRKHTLKMTGGLTYAEMPREVAKLDANKQKVLDSNGNTVMVANTARDIWITATTLTTALNLGILTYVFSTLVLLFGLISVWTGLVFWTLRKHITLI